MIVATMLNRINKIGGFNKIWLQGKEVFGTFPALKYLLSLVLTILTIFSTPNPWVASLLLLLGFCITFRVRPLLIFMLVSSVYLWDLKSDIDQIRSAIFPVDLQEITVRLTDLKVVDPKLLSDRHVSYRADVISSHENFPSQVMVNFYNPPVLHRGDVLALKGKLVSKGVKIPGGFDYFDYLAKQKIGGVFYVKAIESQISHFNWFSSIEWLRNRVLYTLGKGYDYGSDQWRIVTGVVIGEKRNLTFEDQQRFMMGGLFHLFAVSGMHVALVALLVFYSLGFLRVPYRLKLLLSPIVLLIYVLMTGASASSLRAFGMVSIWWVGQFLFRTSNLYYLLALCALLQLIFSPLLLYNAGFQFSFMMVFFLIRGMEIKRRVKSFFWIEQDLSVSKPLGFSKKIVSIFFDLIYIGLLVFVASFGLQVYYFRLIQPLTILSAAWSGFCASGIILFSLFKLIVPFEFINAGIDFFIIPLNSFSEFIFNHDYYSYVNSSSLYFVLLYYIFLGLAFFIRRVWLLFLLVMISWLVVLLQTHDNIELYYANIKGSQVVACIDAGTRSAAVYINGRSTQSALARLLSSKRIKTITNLWIGEDYTPFWQLESRFNIKSRGHLLKSQNLLHCSGIQIRIDQDKLLLMETSKEPVEVLLNRVVPNEFHSIAL